MLHVLPIGDNQEHTEETTCNCNPSVIIENGTMICVHNAFDNREFIEQLCDAVNKKDSNDEYNPFQYGC